MFQAMAACGKAEAMAAYPESHLSRKQSWLALGCLRGCWKSECPSASADALERRPRCTKPSAKASHERPDRVPLLCSLQKCPACSAKLPLSPGTSVRGGCGSMSTPLLAVDLLHTSLLAVGVSIPRAWRVPTRVLLQRPLRGEACMLAVGGIHPPGLARAYPRAAVRPLRGEACWLSGYPSPGLGTCLPACCCTTSSWRSLLAFGVSIPRAWRVPTAVTTLRGEACFLYVVVSHFGSCLPPVLTRPRSTQSAAVATADGVQEQQQQQQQQQLLEVGLR